MEPLQGEVHGSIIKLTEDPGLPEGQRVEVVVRVPPAGSDSAAARARIKSYKGLEDWSEDDDRILAEIAQSRREPTHRFGPEPDADE